MRRRDLLQFLAAAPLAARWHPALAGMPAPRYLVLVEFNGGNDGLNTVVPYADPAYHRARPNLAVARDQVLALDEHVGLNPVLAPLMGLWKDRQLAVLQSVGYPEPNRSHFRSIEIWDTGSDADEYLDAGWLARSLPGTAAVRGFTADAVVIGRNPQPVTGNAMRSLVIDGSIEDFAARGTRLRQVRQSTTNPALAHLLAVQDDTNAAARALLDQARQAPSPQGEFPATPFGRSLHEAARLILMDRAAPVIKVALGSFDTHARQRGQQDRLLGEFAAGLAAFRAAMVQAGRWDRVLMFTYSEFGRRVAENASGGTDHGTAAPVFVAGGAVRGGLYGPAPSLVGLDQGDLRYAIDFRSLYNSVLRRWWALPQSPFDARTYPAIGFV